MDNDEARELANRNVERWKQLERSLTNISPSVGQIERIEDMRDYAKRLGYKIITRTQPSREQSLALTHLEDAVMWAVKGIVLEEQD